MPCRPCAPGGPCGSLPLKSLLVSEWFLMSFPVIELSLIDFPVIEPAAMAAPAIATTSTAVANTTRCVMRFMRIPPSRLDQHDVPRQPQTAEEHCVEILSSQRS